MRYIYYPCISMPFSPAMPFFPSHAFFHSRVFFSPLMAFPLQCLFSPLLPFSLPCLFSPLMPLPLPCLVIQISGEQYIWPSFGGGGAYSFTAGKNERFNVMKGRELTALFPLAVLRILIMDPDSAIDSWFGSDTGHYSKNISLIKQIRI